MNNLIKTAQGVKSMPRKKEIKIFFEGEVADPQAASTVLDKLEKQQVHCLPWPLFPYKPSVSFSIAYTEDALLLKYYVQEKFLKASVRNINGEVFKDSCVEVFLSFNQQQYYNLEFNFLGTARAEYGQGRKERVFLSEDTIRQIKHHSWAHTTGEETAWELTLLIPFTVFIYDAIDRLEGKEITANFYKCGDDLPEPHFLSWSPIQSPEPDFHLPQFFGKLLFD